MPATADWLAEASMGYCGKTTPGDHDCASQAKGGWPLSNGEAATWESAVSACLAKCAGCAGCNYISVSQRWRDCGWFRSCDVGTLHTDVPQFLSGMTRRPQRARPVPQRLVPPNKGAVNPGFMTAARERIAASPHLAAAPCHSLPPSSSEAQGFVHHTQYSDRMGTAFNLESVANALHRAACCAGIAILPDSHRGSSSTHHAPSDATRPSVKAILGRHRQRCYNFSQLPSVAPNAATCEPRALDAWQWWFEGPGVSCPTENYYMRAALRTLFEHAALDDTMPCVGEAAGSEDTLVAHVRSGDIFDEDIHPKYAQPPLAFYLAAWRHSGLRRLRVVAQDDKSPVVQLFRLLELQQVGGRGALTVQTGAWIDDLRTLMCARHLALSTSSLRFVLLSNPGLISVYSATPLHTLISSGMAWVRACSASFWIGHGLAHTDHWEATANQQLRLLTSSATQNVSFRRLAPHGHGYPGCITPHPRTGKKTSE